VSRPPAGKISGDIAGDGAARSRARSRWTPRRDGLRNDVRDYQPWINAREERLQLQRAEISPAERRGEKKREERIINSRSAPGTVRARYKEVQLEKRERGIIRESRRLCNPRLRIARDKSATCGSRPKRKNHQALFGQYEVHAYIIVIKKCYKARWRNDKFATIDHRETLSRKAPFCRSLLARDQTRASPRQSNHHRFLLPELLLTTSTADRSELSRMELFEPRSAIPNAPDCFETLEEANRGSARPSSSRFHSQKYSIVLITRRPIYYYIFGHAKYFGILAKLRIHTARAFLSFNDLRWRARRMKDRAIGKTDLSANN